MPLKTGPFSRVKTLRQLIHDLQALVEKHPDAGDCLVATVHSASGATDHINSFHCKKLEESDFKGDLGFFYEEEGLVAGEKVIELSVGGN